MVRTPAIGGVPEDDPEIWVDGLQVLVLSRLSYQDDSVTCPPPLPESQAGGGESGSVGRKEPEGCLGVVSQSQVVEAVCPFLRVVWGGEDDG